MQNNIKINANNEIKYVCGINAEKKAKENEAECHADSFKWKYSCFIRQNLEGHVAKMFNVSCFLCVQIHISTKTIAESSS